MQQLLDGHAASSVFTIPGQVVGHLALKGDLVFGDLLQHKQGSELLGDGGDTKFCVRSVRNIVIEAGVTYPLGVNDFTVVGHEDRAVEVAEPLIVRNEMVDALSLVEWRRLTRNGRRRGQKKQGQEGRKLAWHPREPTNPRSKMQIGQAWDCLESRKWRPKWRHSIKDKLALVAGQSLLKLA